MAKLKMPFHSFTSHGTIGKSLTTQRKGNITIARRKPIPTDPFTDRQRWHRYLYNRACQYWNTLTPTQKNTWETNARRLRITGFNYFMRTELNRLADLKLCLPMDEGQGSTAEDFSGNLNHGAIFGASWVDGYIGSCLSFDAGDDRVKVTDKPMLRNLTRYSIEARVYCKGAGGGTFGMIYNKVGVVLVHSGGDPPTELRVFRYCVGTRAYSTVPITLNQWQHYIFEWDDSTKKITIFREGSDQTTVVTLGVGAMMDDTGDIFIGNAVALNRGWDGLIDELDQYDALLTPAEAKRHYERS